MPIVCRVEDDIIFVHAAGVLRLDDIDALAVEEEAYFAAPGCRGLFLVDARELKVFSPDGADALVARMRIDTPRVVRSAFVIGEGTAALQLTRMVRDAGSDKRRIFTSHDQALAWVRQG
jgi:hypothetical protein